MLIQSKITQPALQQQLVKRPLLLNRLQAGRGKKATLITAPAGYGKSSLVCQWMNEQNLPVAWYSIDESDTRQGTFFRYLLAALQQLDKSLEEALAPLADSKTMTSGMEVISKLIINLPESDFHGFLVLEDYHLINSEEVHSAIAFLLRRLPPSLHLVFISRQQVPLSLAGFRARGDLSEIFVQDLKFTQDEAAELLQQTSMVHLDPSQIQKLFTRTEGWPIGLKLAALSFSKAKADKAPSDILQVTTELTIDYLLEEVLLNQPEDVQHFLLCSSILQRLNPDLCNRLMGIQDSARYLNQMVTGNVPIIPIDTQGQWYRYHQLLLELLSKRLQESTLPTAQLHQLASEWYAENGFWDDAFRHAFASGNMNFAADLLQKCIHNLIADYESKTALNWVHKLPPESLEKHYLLRIYAAFAAVAIDDFRCIEPQLKTLGKEFDHQTADFPKWQKTYARDLLLSINIITLFYRDFSDKTIAEARKALDSLSPESRFSRGAIQLVLGYAYLCAGEPLLAEPPLEEAIDIAESLNHSHLMLEAMSHKVAAKRIQGKLTTSEELINETLQKVESKKIVRSAAISLLSVQQAYIDYRRNKLQTALAQAQQSIEYGKHQTEADYLMRAYHIEAFILAALGKAPEARELMDDARGIARDLGSVLQIWYIETSVVELALHLGDQEKVARWEQQSAPELQQSFSLRYEREALLLAMWALTQQDYQKTIKIISTLRPQSLSRQRHFSILNMDIIAAAALNALGEKAKAKTCLESAVIFAQREGYVRPFIDFSSHIYDLLLKLRKSAHGPVRLYVPELIGVCKPEMQPNAVKKRFILDMGVTLTPRETEIVQFIYAGMTNKEIAETNYVSIGTVKTHVNRVFSKFDVSSRGELIIRVQELGLV